MKDRCMGPVRLAIPFDDFLRLPRHPAYKYEYFQGKAWLSPRPRYYHARLDLASYAPREPASCRLRPLDDADWPVLPPLFAAAFERQTPFCGGSDEERLEASREALELTRAGEDGPLLRPACLVAEDEQGRRLGALLVTLVPPGDPESWEAFRWPTPPSDEAVRNLEGKAHLTWVFVSRAVAGHGLGTALLAGAVPLLRSLGFAELFSTFLLGNESSMLWHWRQGFDLLAYPGSYRRFTRLERLA
ncbi:MAG: GNAT family N-acetyltransferase [Gemmataceae bacterium]|nr:GNAT family N-acetyltransferase [Gemmataceae bacterium]